MTSATSVWGNSGLISSISWSCVYGTFASARRTFMWPGIRPATGWIAYFTSTPFSSRRSASWRTSCCACATAIPYPGTTTTLRANESCTATAPGDDQHGRVEHESRRRGCEPREGVQERDHDWHVRTADRKHEHHAEDEREEDEGDDRPLRLEPGDDRDAEGSSSAEDEHVDDVLAREDDRPSAQELLQLRERDEGPRERDRADERGKRDGERLIPAEHAVVHVELGERDERRRTAADPVEKGDHLRHRRHLHATCSDEADGAS